MIKDLPHTNPITMGSLYPVHLSFLIKGTRVLNDNNKMKTQGKGILYPCPYRDQIIIASIF
jgi:hypothetical protein